MAAIAGVGGLLGPVAALLFGIVAALVGAAVGWIWRDPELADARAEQERLRQSLARVEARPDMGDPAVRRRFAERERISERVGPSSGSYGRGRRG